MSESVSNAPGLNTPAARIIDRFGVAKLAAWTGRHRSRVHAWTWPPSKGGTGGFVPMKVRRPIILGAASEGDVLTFADFEPQPGETYDPELLGERAGDPEVLRLARAN